jgi:two-component system chemotaxis sensor kinase CheA
MAIDMRQFHQAFFEESLEGLANMETELLRLEKTIQGTGAEAAVDGEILNAIFRAAHSIKGGSSTFGFTDVAAFAHVLESCLDALREGRCVADARLISLLLQAVDCLRSLVIAAKTGTEPDHRAVDAVRERLQVLEPAPAALVAETGRREPPAQARWRIVFRPRRQIFFSGNDPLRILRELAALGHAQIAMDATALPPWTTFNPEECYLAWTVELAGPVSREAIEEVFSWVMDECDLAITPLTVAPAVTYTPRGLAEAVASMDAHAESIRVSVPKIDSLINMVGELVITQSMLSQLAAHFTLESLPKLFLGLAQLERNTRELQESVMRIRMLPLSFAFNRLPRLVHDMGQKIGKKVDITISGEQTEIDKTMIERLIDPLLHLVRNCLDHGIEPPEERCAAGKSPTGLIEIKAYQKGSNVVIEIRDDGRGLNHDRIFAKAVERGLVSADARLTPEEIAELIFVPGFSTAEIVSDISGRGVGMDVVRNNIHSLGGSIEIDSVAGRGTRFLVRLPLTLAILDGLSVQVGSHTYILPLVSIAESVRVRPEQVVCPAGGGELYGLRKEYLPLIRLYELFGVEPRTTDLTQGIVVVVEADGRKAGLYVDDLLGQQQVVIKSLQTHYGKVEGISAATILGDGTVAMILDVAGLIRLAHSGAIRSTAQPQHYAPAGQPAGGSVSTVMS